MFFDVFWKSIPSLRYSHFLDSIFSVPFKEMGFSFLSIFYLFDFFYFFWIVLFFLDRLIFWSFFILFLSILFLDGSCRMWHQSGELFLDFKNVENVEKVEKSRKNDEKRGQKKRVEVGPFCTTPIFGQKSCFLPR